MTSSPGQPSHRNPLEPLQRPQAAARQGLSRYSDLFMSSLSIVLTMVQSLPSLLHKTTILPVF